MTAALALSSEQELLSALFSNDSLFYDIEPRRRQQQRDRAIQLLLTEMAFSKLFNGVLALSSYR